MVPEGWSESQLGDFVDIKHGYAFSSEYFTTVEGPVLLTPGNFYETGGYRAIGAKQKRYSGPVPRDYVLKTGDMLVAMTEQAAGLLGSALFVPEGDVFLHNQRLGLVKKLHDDAIDLEFLSHLLATQQVRQRISAEAGGTKVKHTSPAKLEALRCAFPPLPEQKKIAEILSTWDKAIETTEKLLANAEAQKKALMQQLLTGKRRLKGFDGEWKEVRLRDVGRILSGGTPDSTNPALWDGGIAWATPTDITKLHKKEIAQTARTISELGLAESSAKLLPAGSLLVCTRATIGELAIADTDIATNQGFKNLVPNSRNDVEFLYYLLAFNKNKLKRYACGSTFLELSKKDFEKRTFVVPCIKEQRAIAEVLNTASEEVLHHTETKCELLKEKRALMQQLLTGKRRVKINSNK